MLSYEDLQKLKGMKHITYKNMEKDHAFKFMVKACEELLKDNEALKNQIAELREKSCAKEQV